MVNSSANNDALVKEISDDIKLIQDALDSNDDKRMKKVHIYLDGKYTTSLKGFGKSMYNYDDEYGFSYNYLDKGALEHNLKIMRGRLEGVREFGLSNSNQSQSNINVNVPISNKNEVNIQLSFTEAKERIENMPGLNEEQTEEIKAKINELEKINGEKISKKKKWSKVKPILLFVLDKGADVAITIMSLILQMKLGL